MKKITCSIISKLKNEIQEDIKQTQQSIEAEMNRLNIDSIEQVQDIVKIVNEKEKLRMKLKNMINKSISMNWK